MKKLLTLALAVTMLFTATACGKNNDDSSSKGNSSAVTTVKDRNGTEYKIPEKITKIISTSPSNTEILVGLGLGDKIIATDTFSADIKGLKSDVMKLDMQNLNMEKIIELAPDVLFINEINFSGEKNKYDLLKKSGIQIINISAAQSLQNIKDDITLISTYTKTDKKGKEYVSDIDKAIKTVQDKAKGNTGEAKKVYFEIGSAPYYYTCGNSTYLNEVIEMCGAINIYASQKGYLSNTEESVIKGNPDIILTNVAFEGYSYKEILSRKGWNIINAVKNNKVYYVDSNATSRASQNVVQGIKDIANAINPGTFDL